jgi:hypothetical protein
MAIKYTYIFLCKPLQNLPKLGFLVRKYICHLATPINGRNNADNNTVANGQLFETVKLPSQRYHNFPTFSITFFP